MLNVNLLQELLAHEEWHTNNKTNELRKVLPTIEQFVGSGMPLKRFVDILNSSGMEISLATFKTILARLRKEKKEHSSAMGVASAFHQPLPNMTAQAQNIPFSQGRIPYNNDRGHCVGYATSHSQTFL
ncbi:hypothetical protein [Herminiimonas fonticola]|uniref:Uncharacterized protein n=1 Tax=Herminiimonas fonticola TaxID=303380 RepID=A0A4R6GIV8_9BURK|nr:hypothetical protein [Herminiimonas fonticola]RBA25818.1 hypothetical protein Hfont_1451 [Herminiimonas fonticola]TDN94926.1 hypothetical protein EV677_1488 [Herminiimonas fonticola]